MDIKLILTDIEGCITKDKGYPLDLCSLQWIRDNIKKLPPISLNTGRSKPYIEAILQAIGEFQDSIGENGCTIYLVDKDDIIFHPMLNEEILKQKDELKKFLKEKIKNLGHIEPGKEVCVSIFPEKGVSVKDLAEYTQELIKDRFPEFHLVYSSVAVDITPKGIDKGAGMDVLLEIKNLSYDEVLGIGDSLGDYSFLSKLKYKATPANGHPKIKEIATYIAKEEDIKGLIEIFKHFFF
ncbi:MAG: HAD-IIB family hydrolase [Dictyoglomus thermophilum]|uniref:HAD-IIB family hydrolase n=1 Tax=Dictyoglomus thermophilum TaxID=14 RepID=A0A7C3PPG5_DICTH|nr:HAD-IIB family hydrolase [Dictyoglomus thermophilum]TYT24484.1 HAD-IIB family hydrolase [Dictyoglomus thermophilum]